MSKVLFLLKKNSDYGTITSKSGLLNSSILLAKALREDLELEVSLEICIDANEINKFVSIHRPNYCIIEALWVTPEKMRELSKLWPGVDFIIRIHSKVPFLSNEGIAIEWIRGYAGIDNVYVGFNNKYTFQDFNDIGIHSLYLPNIYPIKVPKKRIPDKINIFCTIRDILKKHNNE